MAEIVLGIDFDNTIVNYEGVFYKAALEEGVIPKSVGTLKEDVKRYLIDDGRESAWTELQGKVYGAKMHLAKLYEGVDTFFAFLKNQGISHYIVSHKTRYPYAGEKYDLHQSARNFLNNQGFFKADGFGMSKEQVFFELTLDEKARRVATLGCTHFVDDLPKFFDNAHFPSSCSKLLFSPDGSDDLSSLRFSSFHEIESFLFR